MSDFEKNSTEVLLHIQRVLLGGLERIGEHVEAGTFNVSAKDGAAPPAESGNLTLALLFEVEDVLESRILGFKRSVDPKLLNKTL